MLAKYGKTKQGKKRERRQKLPTLEIKMRT